MNGRINGNGEVMETENVIFYVSYGVNLTDERIIRTFATDNGDTATEERIRNAGNHALVLATPETFVLLYQTMTCQRQIDVCNNKSYK